jgi:hypothetical protein
VRTLRKKSGSFAGGFRIYMESTEAAVAVCQRPKSATLRATTAEKSSAMSG